MILRSAIFAPLLLVACRWPDYVPADREFERSPSEVLDAATIALCDLGAQVERIERRPEEGTVRATRADGTKIDIRIRELTEGYTRMEVETNPDRSGLVRYLHERVSYELARGADPLRGTMLHATYPIGLGACATLVKRGLEALRYPVLQDHRRGAWRRIDSRSTGTIPIRIQLSDEGEGKTHVNYIVGTESTGDNWRTALQIKAVVEDHMFGGRSRN